MYTTSLSIASLALLVNSALANAQVTAAAQLAPRQTNSDPAFVGYISIDGGYSDPRSCSYPQTVSTSGNYVQCCPTTGSCPFYTACSDNSLMAAGTTVACYVNSALTCNTGIVETTPGASGGPSYLACWQKTLGSSPFTFVQNIGSATASVSSAPTTRAVSTGTSTASMTSSGGSSSAAVGSSASSATSSASATSRNVGNVVAGDFGFSGAIGGVVGILMQALL